MSESHVKYERRDITARYIVYFAGIAIVLAVLMHWGLQGLTFVLTGLDGKAANPAESNSVQMSEPRLQENEAADLAAVRREEASRLNSYGWIHRKEQRVSIPIDRAMEAIVEKGLPSWSEKKAEAPK